MKTFDEFLKEQLSNDEELRQEYEALETEYEFKKLLITIQEG